jgi:tRNA (guanine-N7-)-methyltransferase
MDLAGIFGNARPVEIEIGSGKGDFLLQRAADRPEINLLGIEWLAGYAAYAADRASRAGLKNVRLLCADAGEVFAESLACESVQRVHIYFPDPWPKRKHHRRRIIQPGFVQNLRRVLRKGGTVRIVTDHAEYFQHIRLVLGSADGLANLENAGAEAVGSNFEKKYVADGRRFYAVAALRCR